VISFPNFQEGRCVSTLSADSPANPMRLLAAKEIVETLASPRRYLWLLGLFAVFTLGSLPLILKPTGESFILNNGALSNLLGLITGLGAVFAIIAGSDAVAGDQARGAWISLVVAPLSVREIVLGKLVAPIAAWAAISVPTLPAVWALSSANSGFALQALALGLVGTPVALGFGFLAFGLGARLSSVPWALSLSLGALGIAVSPLVWGHDVGARAFHAAFEIIDPFSGALRFYDAVANQSQASARHAAYALPGFVWFVVTFRFALASQSYVLWLAHPIHEQRGSLAGERAVMRA